jgi:hypothetical protein
MLAIKLWSMWSGSVVAKWAAIIGVGLLAWWGNNALQRSVGEKRGIEKVVKKSNEVARKRNAKARTIRNSIKPGSAWKRLQSEYSRADSN